MEDHGARQADSGEVVIKDEPGLGENRRFGNGQTERTGKSADQLAIDDPSIWPIAPQHAGFEILNATIVESEEGVKRELRHLGLLDANEEVSFLKRLVIIGPSTLQWIDCDLLGTSQIDWTRKEDDEIAAALRQCQRALRDQVTSNNARKERLTGLVRDRLAYGAYEKSLEGLEKPIEGAWLKRSARRNKKQKSSSHREEGNSIRRPGEKVSLPDNVKQAMEARRRWIDAVGPVLEAPDVQGKFTGLPERSIYDGLEDLKDDATGRTWIQTISND